MTAELSFFFVRLKINHKDSIILLSLRLFLLLMYENTTKRRIFMSYLHNVISYFSTWKAIYVPADDLTDPAPATTFAHLDATTVLSRGIAELGIYPAVDPLDSTSRIMDPNVVGQEHYEVARGVQKILQVSWRYLTVISLTL